MKNTFGNAVSITLFGESHGEYIGATLDGFPSGVKIDYDFIAHNLKMRSGIDEFSTARREDDNFKIISGVLNGFTTGVPLTILIENKDVSSDSYGDGSLLRPSHADFTAFEKYGEYRDFRGGGHFSGRLTAAIVAVGAIVLGALKTINIEIGTHVSFLHGVADRTFSDLLKDILTLQNAEFPVLDCESEKAMKEEIIKAKNNCDSVGGTLETAVCGLPCGLGEPWFDAFESMLAHAIFSVPAVKGLEFGKGFEFGNLYGSQANDEIEISDGKIVTLTNNNGGINGGITNGMPVIFRTAIKPTPSINKVQKTVDIKAMQNAEIKVNGRHDPAIISRVGCVIDSVTAIVISDMLALRYGADFIARLTEKKL